MNESNQIHGVNSLDLPPDMTRVLSTGRRLLVPPVADQAKRQVLTVRMSTCHTRKVRGLRLFSTAGRTDEFRFGGGLARRFAGRLSGPPDGGGTSGRRHASPSPVCVVSSGCRPERRPRGSAHSVDERFPESAARTRHRRGRRRSHNNNTPGVSVNRVPNSIGGPSSEHARENNEHVQ